MANSIPPAKLLSRRWHTVPGRLRVAELFFDVPLDYAHPNDAAHRLRLFARSVEKRDPSGKNQQAQLPWLVYLPGGPGFGAYQPQQYGITNFLLDKGYKILYFDHRGMGLSTPITAATLASRAGPSAEAQANYLKHFRADSAVKDLEAIRKCLTADYPADADSKKWSIMGQSYGGFVAVTYLSKFPEGLKEVFTMGGLPPVTQTGPDDVYRRLYRKVEERNKVYYEKFPEDVQSVRRICNFLATANVQLVGGGKLTPERFMSMGISFGVHGGLDSVHAHVLRALNDLDLFGFLTRPTLSMLESQLSLDDVPLYAVLHEPIYCQGDTAANWSADRILTEFPRFSINAANTQVFFTGEMVFKHQFAAYPELQLLAPPAELIATSTRWSDLYDIHQLQRNEVPVYSSTYVDDMYVDFGYAQETASLIKGCKTFVTNTMYHDAPSKKGEELMRALFALKEDSLD